MNACGFNQKLCWVLARGWELANRLHKVNNFTWVVQASSQQESKDTTTILTRGAVRHLCDKTKEIKPLLYFQVASLQLCVCFLCTAFPLGSEVAPQPPW